MAIGVVDLKDFETELNKAEPINTIIGQVIDKTPLGRGENNKEVPDALRKIIGETSVIEGRQEALALGRMFDVSPSSVSAYANGATSTGSYNQPESGLKRHINKRKERISKRAGLVLNRAMDELTSEDKLRDVKPIELASIAKSMSSIIKEMEPPAEKSDSDAAGNVQFILYAPQITREEKYEVINLNE